MAGVSLLVTDKDKQCTIGLRAMGPMSLRILELCLSFSPHPNISDIISLLVSDKDKQ